MQSIPDKVHDFKIRKISCPSPNIPNKYVGLGCQGLNKFTPNIKISIKKRILSETYRNFGKTHRLRFNIKQSFRHLYSNYTESLVNNSN